MQSARMTRPRSGKFWRAFISTWRTMMEAHRSRPPVSMTTWEVDRLLGGIAEINVNVVKYPPASAMAEDEQRKANLRAALSGL